jgi:hypothetical protein
MFRGLSVLLSFLCFGAKEQLGQIGVRKKLLEFFEA